METRNTMSLNHLTDGQLAGLRDKACRLLLEALGTIPIAEFGLKNADGMLLLLQEAIVGYAMVSTQNLEHTDAYSIAQVNTIQIIDDILKAEHGLLPDDYASAAIDRGEAIERRYDTRN